MHLITAVKKKKIKLQQNYCCYRLEMQFTINCRSLCKILIKLKCNWQCTISNFYTFLL